MSSTALHCFYGTCRNDKKNFNDPWYPEKKSVTFISFPKPVSDLDKCQRRIKLCGRAKDQLIVEKLGSKRGKDVYICSVHFVGRNVPNEEYPYPLPAISLGTLSTKPKKARRPPRVRSTPQPPSQHPSKPSSSETVSAIMTIF